GIAGVAGRNGSNLLPGKVKGQLGGFMGGVRSGINQMEREGGRQYRDPIKETGKYWYPDGRSGQMRFEDKFGVSAGLSKNQKLAQRALKKDFQLYSFVPADIGKIVGTPAAAAAPQFMRGRQGD
ncbi:MAG: hypothetical protein JWM33_3481, partial [Caulobacteraceae bacterium]|nr:hypothetical protein [Caulobacteraceae bacterium]